MAGKNKNLNYDFGEAGLTARHLRLTIFFPATRGEGLVDNARDNARSLRNSISDDDNEESFMDESLFIQSPFRINPKESVIRRDPVGYCIYCGSTIYSPNSSRPLSDEHVVAEGLGGTLVLPEASCQSCEVKTSAIEGAILRKLLWAPRHVAKIRMKRRKRDNRGFPVNAYINGVEREVFLPLEFHPTLLFFPILNPPGILYGRGKHISGVQGMWAIELNSSNKITKLGINRFHSPVLDMVRFCQFLAKIAHGFTYANLKKGMTFKPYHNEFILKKYERAEQNVEMYHLIGGTPVDLPPSDSLHVLGIGESIPPPENLTVVAIRLFADYGAPTFHVVTGEVTINKAS